MFEVKNRRQRRLCSRRDKENTSQLRKAALRQKRTQNPPTSFDWQLISERNGSNNKIKKAISRLEL